MNGIGSAEDGPVCICAERIDRAACIIKQVGRGNVIRGVVCAVAAPIGVCGLFARQAGDIRSGALRAAGFFVVAGNSRVCIRETNSVVADAIL